MNEVRGGWAGNDGNGGVKGGRDGSSDGNGTLGEGGMY